ncbi:MAG: DNA polymerase III subunit beta [Candidatus Omnitrophica bacterium]|nr:DNA polymerase III subunit beta [Candidatus Omnitrophota bacterium]
MKINTNKEEFLKAIGLVGSVVSAKATLPILSNILVETSGMDEIKVVGTDLEIGISGTFPVKVVEEGSVTIPGRKINDIVRELPTGIPIEISVSKNSAVSIKTKSGFFRIMGLPKDDFPKTPEFSLENAIEIDQKALKECLVLTSFAMSRDEARYVLNGALFVIKEQSLIVVTTDGRRLAMFQKPVSVPPDVSIEAIVPAKAVGELVKLLSDEGSVKIVLTKNQIVFVLKNLFLISRLIEGAFPNYTQVVPKDEKTTSKLKREEFLSALRRAALLTTPEAQAVKLDFLKGKLLISSRSPNLGESKEEIGAEHDGEDVVIGFNPYYLIDVLKSLDVDDITMSLTVSDRPGVIKGKEGYTYVVMPMQLA